MRDLVFHGKEHTPQVGVVHPVPLFGTELVQRLLDRDAGIVESDVELAVGGDRLIDEGFDIVLDQDIGPDIERLATGLFDLAFDLRAKFGSAAAESDLATFSREGEGGSAPNAGGCAGDRDDLAFKAAATRALRNGWRLGRGGKNGTCGE